MRAAVALVLLLAAGPAAADWFVAAGRADYARGGGAGHWDQPPLQSEWRLRTGAVALGYRRGDVEIALHDLGRVTVHGFYVPDADYDPVRQQVRDGARTWRGIVSQHTQGLSLTYAPQWRAGQARWGVAAGALVFRQRSRFDIDWTDGQCCSTDVAQTETGITPLAGVRVGYEIAPHLVLGVAAHQAWRVRRADAPAGGTGNRPGLTLYLLTLSLELP